MKLSLVVEINEIKFTKKNLKRHLSTDEWKNEGKIFTIRDEKKGNVGDLFRIKGIDDDLFVLIGVSETDILYPVFLWEGFETSYDLHQELKKIYGDNYFKKCLYLHKLLKLTKRPGD